MRTFKDDLERDLKDPEFARMFWKEYRKAGRQLKRQLMMHKIWEFIKKLWKNR